MKNRYLIILLTLSFMFLCKAANAGNVYWNPIEGNDSYLGTSAISPVRTFERAKYLVSQQPEGSYIVLVRYLYLHDGEVVTLDGKISETRNVLLKQHGEAVTGHGDFNTTGVDGYNFILRHSGTKLTLKNITIEGTYTGTGINPYTGPTYPTDVPTMILLENNTQLVMEEGAVLKNCHRDVFAPSDPQNVGYGAAVYMWPGASFTMNGGVIEDCITDYGGGAICMQNGTTFTMNGGTIQNCHTGQYGGAIYARLGSATINLNGGVIKDCYVRSGTGGGRGGAIGLHAPSASIGNYSLTMNGGEIDGCSAYSMGGGIYVEGNTGATNTITLTKGSIHDCVCRPSADNISAGWGGAVCIDYGTVNVNGAQMLIHHNYARKYGAAINAGGNVSIVFSAGKIYNNTTGIDADDQGVVTAAAAFHAYSGASISMSGGEMYGNHTSGVGGAMHASGGGGITISGGKIYNNSAKDQGGAINVNVDTPVSFVAGAGGTSCEVYGNRAVCAGVVAIDGSTLTIAAGSFHDNVADQTIYPSHTQKGRGGAFYVKTSDNTHIGHLIISGGEVYNNVASIDGGAVYLEKKPDSSTSEDIPSVTISGGSIHDNTAISGNGGGIYYDTGAKMYVDNGSMTVKDNTAQGSPNNVYIRTGNVIDIKSDATFTPVYVGFYTENRTPNIPVFSGTDEQVSAIYNGMTSVPMKTNVVDDSQDFSPLRPGSPGTEYNYILYFGDGSPWSPLQQTVNTLPTKVNNVYQIGTVKELTAFLWLVNNIDTHHDFNEDLGEDDETTHPEASARLTADINMEGHYWVPIANYTGTFDGNGYIISHLTMVPSNVESERGLFGVNTSGTIKNVNLRDGYFGGGGSYIGTVVSQMNGGTLYNSVAQCQMLATATSTTAGGLVGYINGGTVHSSIATCEMTGYTMGGLAGKISSSGNLFNSFANPQFTYSGATNAYFVGGIVAENAGTVANCYVRFSRTQALTGAKFGQLAGNNDNTINPCYTPFTSDVPSTIVHTGSATSDTYKVVDAPYLYNRPNDNLVGSDPLFVKLNEWVSSKIKTIAELAYWKRTTAGGYSYTYNDGVANITVTGGNINDDYPMPKMKGLSNVSSVDGFYFDYAPSLSRAINKYNGLTGGGTVWLYASPKNAAGADEEVNVDNDSDVLLYIDEDATLLQADNNSLTAYTSQTLKVETESRWHFISSSLSNSDIGFNYGTTSQVDFDWSENPCNVTFNGNNDDALFPIDMPNINKVDLYAFYEPEYHWLNLKRNTNSHWHMNATTTPIAYNGNGTGGNGNETYLVPGKGYLASIDKDQLLQNKGTLNNGAGTVTVQDVTYNEANAWAGLLGYNLLGNPYQSYLDFNAFITDAANSGLNASKGNAEPTYAVYDPEIGSYIQYKSGSSKGSRSADGMIHPHQGFMIRRTGGSYSATATFKNTMRSTNSTSPFRGEQPAFPLVNLTVTDNEGNADVAVLELGRDADRGAEKLRANTCKGWLYLHHDNDDYGILFRSEVEDYQPLWFEASEAGTYTMRWETANGEFESLTLVDNIAGVVTDMLATDSYVFEANPDQYKSRFKIVIGDYKDIEENEGGASTSSATDEIFAFISNGNIIVNGIGTLQVIDILGRELVSEELSTPNSQLSTLNYTPGVYVLRLTTGKGTKIQKMVIE